MLDLTQKRLTRRFAFVVLLFTVLLQTVILLYFHRSIMKAAEEHLRDEIQNEFIDQFHRTGLDTFKVHWDEYRFQILNRNGEIIISSPKTRNFYPRLNRELLGGAFSGESGFEKLRLQHESYLVAYFPLNEEFSGRVAACLTEEFQYERNFLKLLILTLPVILALSFLLSRYLVKHAMKPVSDVFTYQEHFSSTVTHELRSPLASLKGNLEVALRKERPAEEYRETLRFGLTEVDRITNLLNDLSLLSSSKFKPLDLFKERVDVRKIIAETVDAYRPRILTKGIRIENSVAAPIVCVCDEGLVRRVFDNILNNAMKYTPPEGVITIKSFEAMGKMLINVSNTCQGLSRGEVAYLFEPFYRGKNVLKENFEGKGLGLFISRYILRSHGGDITVKLTDHNIFSLTVSLPAQ
jgi:signal transduction histidine kinase